MSLCCWDYWPVAYGSALESKMSSSIQQYGLRWKSDLNDCQHACFFIDNLHWLFHCLVLFDSGWRISSGSALILVEMDVPVQVDIPNTKIESFDFAHVSLVALGQESWVPSILLDRRSEVIEPFWSLLWNISAVLRYSVSGDIFKKIFVHSNACVQSTWVKIQLCNHSCNWLA